MKTIIVGISLLLVALGLQAQDGKELILIDSLVNVIESGDFETEYDTSETNLPNMGISMKTITTVVYNDQLELVKYVNHVISVSTIGGQESKMVATNIFFYHENKLIKVMESGEKDEEEFQADWYYKDDQCLHYTLDNPKAQQRSEMLPGMAKAIQRGLITKKL